jgi:Fe-S cluster biogenesis protein NfuA
VQVVHPAVVAEHTPNPDAIKFLLGRPVAEGAHDFASGEDALNASPLAAALFALRGVERVYLGPDFAVVTKRPDTDWGELGDEAVRTLREFLASGRDALCPGASAPVHARGDAAADRVRRVLRDEIHAIVAAHGGEVELVDYTAGVARLALHGACAGCPASEATLRIQIERRLREALPDLVRVEQA